MIITTLEIIGSILLLLLGSVACIEVTKWFDFHFHTWGKWSEVKRENGDVEKSTSDFAGINSTSNIQRVNCFQERSCESCGETQRRFLQATSLQKEEA